MSFMDLPMLPSESKNIETPVLTYMSVHERVAAIIHRNDELINGAQPLFPLPEGKTMSSVDIATKEVDDGLVSFIITKGRTETGEARTMPFSALNRL